MNLKKETPYRFLRKWDKKWSVIDKDKYPNNGIVRESIFDGVPCQEFVGYVKDEILCFYWGTGKSKFNRMSGGEIVFTLYRESFNKIKEWVELNNYKGLIAFELCEMEQLNKVVEYMINRQGYKAHKENGYLIVN